MASINAKEEDCLTISRSKDLIKWKKARRKFETSAAAVKFPFSFTLEKFAILCLTLLLQPQPQNAMPIPKIENNSLTSAMVSLILHHPLICSNRLTPFQAFFQCH